MSGWQLGLALFGMALFGFGSALVTVWAYARHVYRQKVGGLIDGASQLTGAATTGRPVEPPPPR